MKLEYMSAADIGYLVNECKISAIDVLKYFENRIKERNKYVNAFVYTRFEEAYKKAEEIDNKIAKGEFVGPFAGVPFALKDFLPNKPGWTNSHGGVECLIKEDTCYSEFCKAMEKLGGIAIGKTNAPAYGFRGTTDNKLYGPTHNPFDLSRNSGGSSGGSAAAVAEGLVPIAEGGDAGGSIRIPAAWCNLYGFKPGVGTVPSVIRPDAWSATHPFCFNFALTKTVQDAAILLDAMSYYDSRDPYSLGSSIDTKYSDIEVDNHKYRIAVTFDFDLFEVDNEIKDKISEVANILMQNGHKVDYVKFNFNYSAKEMADSWCQSLIFDSVIEIEQDKRAGNDYINNYRDQFPEEITYWIDKCKNSNIWDLYKFNLIRTNILDNFEDKFEKYDFILSPVSCCLPALNSNDNNTKGPAEINGKAIDPLIGWSATYLVNFTGHPAASIPAGLSKDNLPIGVQFISKKYFEDELIRLSKLLEMINPWDKYFQIPFNR